MNRACYKLATPHALLHHNDIAPVATCLSAAHRPHTRNTASTTSNPSTLHPHRFKPESLRTLPSLAAKSPSSLKSSHSDTVHIAVLRSSAYVRAMSPLTQSESVDSFLTWLAAPSAPSSGQGHVSFIPPAAGAADREHVVRLREVVRSPLEDIARPLIEPVPSKSPSNGKTKTPQPSKSKSAENIPDLKKQSSPTNAQ